MTLLTGLINFSLLWLFDFNVNFKSNYISVKRQYDRLLRNCKTKKKNLSKYFWNTGETINKDSTLSRHPEETTHKYN